MFDQETYQSVPFFATLRLTIIHILGQVSFDYSPKKKKMSSSLEISDDEEEVFFEVEEIVQMFITDSGARMFEIKWKNYDSK